MRGIHIIGIGLLVLAACGDPARRALGAACDGDAQCASGLCVAGQCLDPAGDEDKDGLTNGFEAGITSNPLDQDTDQDGVADRDELGSDVNHPTDTDGDGKPDVLESSLADKDGDCITDQLDADDAAFSDDPSPMAATVCSHLGICAGQDAALRVSCASGQARCDYHEVPGYTDPQSTCDGLDHNCDGHTDDCVPPVTVDVDACVNHGCGANADCTDLPTPAPDAADGRTCSCRVGFDGAPQSGCSDTDACAGHPCGAHADCTDLPAPAPGDADGRTCRCQAGFAGDDPASGCSDLDECADGSTICGAHALCENTVGSHTCTAHDDEVELVVGLTTPGVAAPPYFARAGLHMTVPRTEHAAVTLADGTVLIAGGSNALTEGGDPIASAETFDPRTLTFTATSPMPETRADPTAALIQAASADNALNGKVLIKGGYTGSEFDFVPQVTLLYDPGTRSFAPVALEAQLSAEQHVVSLPTHQLLYLGGLDGGWNTAPAELFDPATSASGSLTTLAGNYTDPRNQSAWGDWFSTTVLADGRVLIAGGDAFWGKRSADMFDPHGADGPTFTPLSQTMNKGRMGHAAVALADGRVLLVGSSAFNYANAGTTSAEIFDPAGADGGTFRLLDAALPPIGDAHGFLLAGGKVAIVGVDPTTRAPAPPLLFDPATEAFTPLYPSTVGCMPEATFAVLKNGDILMAGGDGPPNGDAIDDADILRTNSGRYVVAPIAGDLPSSFTLVPGSVGAVDATTGVFHSVAAGLARVRVSDGETTRLVAITVRTVVAPTHLEIDGGEAGGTATGGTVNLGLHADASITVAHDGDPATHWELVPNTLPAQLAFDAATGTISGITTEPMRATTYRIWAGNDGGWDSAEIQLEVACTGCTAPENLAYPGRFPGRFVYGRNTVAQLTPTWDGGFVSPVTFTVAPELPRGLTLDAATGTISGYPRVMPDPNTEYVVTARNYVGETGFAMHLTMVCAGDGFAGGDGSLSAPYIVATVAQLEEVHCHVGEAFVLAGGLDLAGEAFFPIGSAEAPFTGVFDGNRMTIANWTYEAPPNVDRVGFFGATQSAAITRLGLWQGSVTGTNRVGLLVGEASATQISQVFTTGSVHGNNAVGGLAGVLQQLDGPTGSARSSASDCYAMANVTATGGSMFAGVGGFAGVASVADMWNSYASGAVTGCGPTAGFVGSNFNGATITACFSTGAVAKTYDWCQPVYGLVAWNDSGSVAASAWDVAGSGNPQCIHGNGYDWVADDAACHAHNVDGGQPGYFADPTHEPMWTWDFTAIWAARPGGGPPALGWEL